MITALRLQGWVSPINRWVILICALYMLVLLTALRTFVLWQSVNFLLGSIALVNASVFKKDDKGSYRYAFAALLFVVISLILPIKTILFFALAFAVFFVIDSLYGRMNVLPLFIVVMMSPLFQYITNTFSFPIRLQLTAWAGSILTVAGMSSKVEGNMIHCNGNEFTVDPTCMGLNMMITSLLLGIMIIAVYQKKYAHHLRVWQIIVSLIVVSTFNVVSNLLRIVCLVQFNILPDTFMHDVVGTICLFIYVILPSIVFIKWIIHHCGKRTASVTKNQCFPTKAKKLITMHFLVAVSIVVSSAVIIQKARMSGFNACWVPGSDHASNDSKRSDLTKPFQPILGYRGERISADIIKLENDKALVYIKAIPGFYSADHNPMICWKGSGYKFMQMQEQYIGGLKVYAATLQNNQDILYTAWWYDNGYKRTVDQLTWRWDALKTKKNYSVVNVTCSSKELLKKEIQEIQRKERLKSLL